MSDEEKNSIELDIEAKYVGKTEKEFLNNITYAECLYTLDAKNKYCDDIKNLSLLKIVDIVNEQSKEIEELSDKLTEKICKGVEEEILEEYRQTIISKDKEIEELKDTRSIFNMGRRSYKNEIEDKIKAKIEEVKDGTYDAKIVLQSLLEKE